MRIPIRYSGIVYTHINTIFQKCDATKLPPTQKYTAAMPENTIAVQSKSTTHQYGNAPLEKYQFEIFSTKLDIIIFLDRVTN